MVNRLTRYAQIARILSKYGFGIVLQELYPENRRPDFLKKDPEIESDDVYRRIRLAIEELGPTFVKLGQILSVRRDVLPAPLIQELQMLTDKVKTVPYEDIQDVIQETCGVEDEFCVFVDHEPIAGASMSQVHKAVMTDGSDVVFKVQRPDIRELIEVDLTILENLAERAENALPYLRPFNPVGLIEEYSKQMRKELDFVLDGKNAETVALNMKEMPGVKVPKIYWEHSGTRLLVLEYIEGIRIDDVDTLREKYDLKKLADVGFEAYLKQVFIDGFFHGDPHPGNLLVNEEGQIVFLDFGMVGILRPERRISYTKIFYAIISNDIDMLIDTLAELGIKIDPDDIENFKDEMYVIYKQTENYKMDQFSFGDTMNTLTSILQRYKIVMPGSFMLMIKVITMIGDVGSNLDPEFDIIGKTLPYLNKLVISSVFSAESLDDARQTVTRELLGFPKAFRRFLENFSSGRSRMEVTIPEFRELNDGVEYLAQKIVYSVLAVGFMISVALIAPTCTNPFIEWQGYLLMGGLTGLALTLIKLLSLRPKK
ncbi:AarF/ABC1/UbiB kinase family protein [Candidatus Bathyarchaeota archaeon]|jgi:ubiquinone biosynthesis protein|nr:AarF/ABC1/UbiB kinase family protein [Candidatus Bathyarchaeota archaeon]MBT4319907.1 AarF/ABC1/UbiB kinase family protein [Candidatus Bathyarchaeota archaeon]MBT4422829.1 AarF/ABC1/UbiB kinase family protein [Candidatus Bathyarchaeota archaeon]MBT7186085.1 AarF/ABC1/UbiB kinase family protein [Candidatus Bathyarchaeota archaeon]MBT7347552.1 AarF/ABC1/UbiB kinase family protein [Candidatus Bathyarchaeota archaeon]